MRAAIARELVVIARRLPWTLSVCAHVVMVGAFTLTWSHGVPLAATSVYDQQQIVGWIWLAVLLPWTATRCVAADRGDALVYASVTAAIRPSTFIIAKVVALAVSLSLIVVSGLPLAIIAQQMSALPVSRPVLDTLIALGPAIFVGAATVGWMCAFRDRSATWIATTITASASLWILTAARAKYAAGGLILALLGIGVALVVAAWSDRSSAYLAEVHG